MPVRMAGGFCCTAPPHAVALNMLLDFPPDQVREAWNFAESACWDRGLEADLLPYDGCKPAFLAHIAPDLRILA